MITDTQSRTVRFPTDLADRLVAAAAQSGRTFTDVVIEACGLHAVDLAPSDRTVKAFELVPRRGDVNSQTFAAFVDGAEVPRVEVHETSDPRLLDEDDTKRFTVTLDNRFSTGLMARDRMWPLVWMIANAMAIGAGWSCHGPHGRQLSPADQWAWSRTLDERLADEEHLERAAEWSFEGTRLVADAG